MRNPLSRTIPKNFQQHFLEWVISEGMGVSYNTHRINMAWDACSGLAKWTSSKFFKDGILYINLNCSSVVKTHARMQSDNMVQQLNIHLQSDDLFIKNRSFTKYIDKIVIR